MIRQTAAEIEAAHRARVELLRRREDLVRHITRIGAIIEERNEHQRLMLLEGRRPTRNWKEKQEPVFRESLRRAHLELGETEQELENYPTCRCGALTRDGGVCQRPAVEGRRRCPLHGGKSTGPKTREGREAIAAANRARTQASPSAEPQSTS